MYTIPFACLIIVTERKIIQLYIFFRKLPCPDHIKYHLYGLAVQAEIGDYDINKHPNGYISQFNFIHNQTYDLCANIARLHLQNFGMSAAEAELKFLTLSSGKNYYFHYLIIHDLMLCFVPF